MPPQANPLANHDRKISHDTEYPLKHNTRISLVVPEGGLSCDGLAELLRGLGSVLAFSAIQHAEPRAWRDWNTAYQQFMTASIYRLIDAHFPEKEKFELSQEFKSELSRSLSSRRIATTTDLFAQFIQERCSSKALQLLPLESIERGSYEFIFHAANLIAIFGLQEIPIIKDCVQFVASSFREAISSEHGCTAASPHGQGAITFSVELFRVLRSFDEVQVTEERTSDRTHIKIHLKKHSST